LALGPRPVLNAHKESRVVVIGRALGTRVHASGVPWDDKSGENLVSWMVVSNKQFYDPKMFAIIPMGFCYPGKGKSGDLGPRKECAPQWHKSLFDLMPNVELVLLIGKYAQDYYLPIPDKLNLTERVRRFENYLPEYFVLPHPSPRNNIWQAKNPWFGEFVLPAFKEKMSEIL
jgi:uracil-DNA glycosylase